MDGPAQVAILGASGGTGSAMARLAVRKGLGVRVLARDPRRLPTMDGRIDVVAGDVEDPSAVARVVDGVDLVLSAIGRRPAYLPARHVSVCETASKNVVQAVGGLARVRYVAVSSAGAIMPGESLLWYERAIVATLRAAYGADFADRDREAALLRASGVRWTLIRPSTLVGGPTGNYAFDRDRIVGPWTSREAVADFAFRVAADDSFIGTAPYVASWTPPGLGQGGRFKRRSAFQASDERARSSAG